MKFIHELPEVETLFRAIAAEKKIDPYLVEKDYWIMHALWGLQDQGYDYELKGGTSLSKGYGVIKRFSEDIDIKIIPKDNIPTGKNQNKPIQVQRREQFFENLATEINIPSMNPVRDNNFDDEKFRNAGIRLEYTSLFEQLPGVKSGVLLEVGFDTTTPNDERNISSWAYDRAVQSGMSVINNQANSVKCYLPEYTFVEKLQTIVRKTRQQQETGTFSQNFLRHFYDIHQLFQLERVKKFIGTKEYVKHKTVRFKGDDDVNLKANMAFRLNEDEEAFELYTKRYASIRNLFYDEPATFQEIYSSLIEIRING